MANNKTRGGARITHTSHTAGELADSRVPITTRGATCGDVVALLKNSAVEFASINYIYIVDNAEKLCGVISIKDVLTSSPQTSVKDKMAINLVVARRHTFQERVAHLALKANIKAVPVIDKEHHFLGAVLSDTILDIIYAEGIDDMAHMAGVPNMPIFESLEETPVATLVRHRLPWLILGLGGGVLAATIVGIFEVILSEHLILASFIPLIMYMGGSSLSQAQSFFIRDLAITPKLHFKEYMKKQAYVTFIIALILSACVYTMSLFLLESTTEIAHVLAIALFSVLISTLLTSFIIPYMFFVFHKDPADGSGPLSTIIQDLIGISLYLGVALMLL